MRRNPRLKLRKIGKMYMIVDSQSGAANLTNVYQLNDTAATLWQRVGEEHFTTEQAAQILVEEYDVEPAEVQRDVEQLLERWREFGLIISE